MIGASTPTILERSSGEAARANGLALWLSAEETFRGSELCAVWDGAASRSV